MNSTTGNGLFYFREYNADRVTTNNNRLSLGTETRITVNYNPTAVDIVRNHDSVPRASGAPQVALDLSYEIETCQIDSALWKLITTGRIAPRGVELIEEGDAQTSSFTDFDFTTNSGNTIDFNRWYRMSEWPALPYSQTSSTQFRLNGSKQDYGENDSLRILAYNHDYVANFTLGLIRFLPAIEKPSSLPFSDTISIIVRHVADSDQPPAMPYEQWPVSDYEAQRGVGDLYIYDDRDTVVWCHKDFPCTIYCSSDVTFNPTEVAKPTITVAPHVDTRANPSLGQLFVANRYTTN